VVGVPRADLAPFVARCLQRLGTKRAWVVNGSGLDELTLTGPTASDSDATIVTVRISPIVRARRSGDQRPPRSDGTVEVGIAGRMPCCGIPCPTTYATPLGASCRGWPNRPALR
jgi:hypothetical protein